MSHRIEIKDDKTGKVLRGFVIQDEEDGICPECHRKEELRPYGPKGAPICYDCARKDWPRTEHNMGIQLFGEPGELQ